MIQSGNLYAIHSDYLNTPRQIDNSSASVVWYWDSLTYGATQPNTNPMGLGTFNYNLRFSGQYYDQESGLFQNWHRDYNPELGRYIETDPIGLGGGLNRFSYVNDNPLGYSDPMGLRWVYIQLWDSSYFYPKFDRSPGHVMATDQTTENYISHYPTNNNQPLPWNNDNNAMNGNYEWSEAQEGRVFDYGFWVWIPDPDGFNDYSKDLRQSGYSLFNNSSNTNCVKAVKNALSAGGFNVPWWVKTPTDFDVFLEAQANSNSTDVRATQPPDLNKLQ